MASASNPVLARGDHTPEFADDETGERMIGEDAAAGDDVQGDEDPDLDPVTATDGDTTDILTYSLSGLDAASFTIEQADDTAIPATVGGRDQGEGRDGAGPRDQADPHGDGHGQGSRRA